MKRKLDNKHITGYIEGFYGQLLDWKSRKSIVMSLHKNKMNTYFYAPKEDICHRLKWRDEYSLKWRKKFRGFCSFCKKKNIRIIAGIAPGLDFNFKKFNENSNKNFDFNLLVNKANQLIEDGASSIALLLDDIPDHFKKNFGKKISEGTSHGKLANKLSQELGQNICFVPRIYADELIKDDPRYLIDLSKILDQDFEVFYCGENVVSKIITNDSKIKKIIPNKIIYWDNFYANDYCPRRFYIGPYTGRKQLNNFMVNPTGFIKTDLLILDIITSTKNKRNCTKEWLKILKIHGVPLIFNQIRNFFSKPNFGPNPLFNTYKVNLKNYKALEYLLWSWKSELSREWYPYLYGLKQDLQINQGLLSSERLIKTQTQPLAQHIKII